MITVTPEKRNSFFWLGAYYVIGTMNPHMKNMVKNIHPDKIQGEWQHLGHYFYPHFSNWLDFCKEQYDDVNVLGDNVEAMNSDALLNASAALKECMLNGPHKIPVNS